MAKKTVVLFEDDKTQLGKLTPALKAAFRSSGINVFCFAATDAASIGETYEKRLKDDLTAAQLGEIALFITDRDLSKTLPGFSESVVSRISDEWAIPMCVYSQAEKDALRRASNWSDLKIILDITKGAVEVARECKIICAGFEEIGGIWQKLSGKSGKMISTPAELLATILGEPDIKERIALYGAGDQHMLAEIFPFFRKDEKSKKKRLKDLQNRMKRSLGYWLWDSIIRFPGLLVNPVAAASYLGIAENDFLNKAQALFKSARYVGPFSEIEPLWWRHKLDGILTTAGAKTGLDYARKHGLKNISPCKCSFDGKPEAGYYCMVQRKPVCAKHSKSNISWFPSGADLARISNATFDELAPWLGLYN